MKRTKILYWVFTVLFSFMMLGSAIPDILSSSLAVEGFKQLGLPAFLVPFLGIAKTLGVIAILVPGFARLKEWAYAGLFFDLIGATYLIIASGQPAGSWAFMILPLAFFVASYYFYHRKLRLTTSGSAMASRVNESIAAVA